MGVGVGAAHHFPSVFKHLHPLVGPTQLCDLIGPFVNDPAYLGEVHEGEGQIGARMETHDTTSTGTDTVGTIANVSSTAYHVPCALEALSR